MKSTQTVGKKVSFPNCEELAEGGRGTCSASLQGTKLAGSTFTLSFILEEVVYTNHVSLPPTGAIFMIQLVGTIFNFFNFYFSLFFYFFLFAFLS